MAKKKTKKKPAKNKPPSPTTLLEDERFFADNETTSPGKNRRLASLAGGPMLGKPIVAVRRIEIGSKHGWLFVYRA